MPNALGRLEAHEVRRLAVAAEVDPRTVIRYLAGKTIKPMSRVRIERALARESR
jgi:hypothetical protein